MESGLEVTRDEIVALLADRDAAHAALLAAKDAEIAAKPGEQTACQARVQGRDQLTDTELTRVRSRYLGALAKASTRTR